MLSTWGTSARTTSGLTRTRRALTNLLSESPPVLDHFRTPGEAEVAQQDQGVRFSPLAALAGGFEVTDGPLIEIERPQAHLWTGQSKPSEQIEYREWLNGLHGIEIVAVPFVGKIETRTNQADSTYAVPEQAPLCDGRERSIDREIRQPRRVARQTAIAVRCHGRGLLE